MSRTREQLGKQPPRYEEQAYRYPGGVMEWRAAGRTLAVAGDDAP